MNMKDRIQFNKQEQKNHGKFVPLDILDEVNSIVSDLEIITYLNLLVEDDFKNDFAEEILKSENKNSVEFFLLQIQTEKIKNLSELVMKISI